MIVALTQYEWRLLIVAVALALLVSTAVYFYRNRKR